MGFENYKIIKSFITEEESQKIVHWIECLQVIPLTNNKHMSNLSDSLKGKASMFNQSKTELTNYITEFQATSQIQTVEVPDFIIGIQIRIAKALDLPMDNIFFQAVDMPKGGSIGVHYDASLTGWINYKCNLSVLSDDYNFYIDKDVLRICSGDLYCFEASLYKHWTDIFSSRRVFLSFGFILPYDVLGRKADDPRVRLGQRIQKYFQS